MISLTLFFFAETKFRCFKHTIVERPPAVQMSVYSPNVHIIYYLITLTPFNEEQPNLAGKPEENNCRMDRPRECGSLL